MGMLQNRETAYKIALVGDPCVGKSALICRYMDNSIFINEYEPTFIDTFTSETSLVDPGDGLTRHIQITIKDIGSKIMKESMLAEQDALIFCYDVTNQESFYSLSKLFQMNMQLEYLTSKKRPIILVGCKSD